MQHRNVFGSPDALAADFLHLMNLAAAQAIAERGAFHVALTGGSAAQALYPVLAQTPMPWAQIHLWFGDERAVPPEHADSNYGLAQQALLSRIAIPVANVHRMEGELAPSAVGVSAHRGEQRPAMRSPCRISPAAPSTWSTSAWGRMATWRRCSRDTSSCRAPASWTR